MRYFIALVFPWLTFFTMGKPLQGILCLLLQITLIGWIPATIWAFASISSFHADKRVDVGHRIDRQAAQRRAELEACLAAIHSAN
jgi:uncharacterized membrane protein YqaE (UPF0057 family)